VCIELDQINLWFGILKEINIPFAVMCSQAEFARALRLISERAIEVEPTVPARVVLDQTAAPSRPSAIPTSTARSFVEPT